MFKSIWRMECHSCLVKAKFAYLAEIMNKNKGIEVDLSNRILKDLRLYYHWHFLH